MKSLQVPDWYADFQQDDMRHTMAYHIGQDGGGKGCLFKFRMVTGKDETLFIPRTFLASLRNALLGTLDVLGVEDERAKVIYSGQIPVTCSPEMSAI